jgi:hypothetical protein
MIAVTTVKSIESRVEKSKSRVGSGFKQAGSSRFSAIARPIEDSEWV